MKTSGALIGSGPARSSGRLGPHVEAARSGPELERRAPWSYSIQAARSSLPAWRSCTGRCDFRRSVTRKACRNSLRDLERRRPLCSPRAVDHARRRAAAPRWRRHWPARAGRGHRQRPSGAQARMRHAVDLDSGRCPGSGAAARRRTARAGCRRRSKRSIANPWPSCSRARAVPHGLTGVGAAACSSPATRCPAPAGHQQQRQVGRQQRRAAQVPGQWRAPRPRRSPACRAQRIGTSGRSGRCSSRSIAMRRGAGVSAAVQRGQVAASSRA
jgi:hypothetical protein